MKVAKIAAAPICLTTGSRLPISAQANPPMVSRTIAIRMSDGTLPVATKPAISGMSRMNTGTGTMPILVSTIRHQPRGQNGVVADRSSMSAVEVTVERMAIP